MIEDRICDKCNGSGVVERSFCRESVYHTCWLGKICGTDCKNYRPIYTTLIETSCDRCRGKGGIYWVDQLFEEQR